MNPQSSTNNNPQHPIPPSYRPFPTTHSSHSTQHPQPNSLPPPPPPNSSSSYASLISQYHSLFGHPANPPPPPAIRPASATHGLNTIGNTRTVVMTTQDMSELSLLFRQSAETHFKISEMFSKYTKSSVPSSPVLSDYPRNIPQQSSNRPSDFPNGHPNSAAQTNGENAAQLPNEDSNARAPVKPPKKKIPRDPNAPKKPLSSYMLFCHDVRDKISEENPGINQQEVARIMGTLWKELPAEKKLEYDSRYKAAKVVYDSEFAEYKHNKDSSAQPSSNPTAPSSAPQSQISPQTGPPTPTSTTAAAIPNSSRQPAPGQIHHPNEHNPSHPNSSTANSFAIQPSMLNNRSSEGGVGVLPWFTPMNNGGVNLGNFLYQDLYRQTPQGWPNPHGQGNPVREGGVSEGGRFPDMNHSVTQKQTNAPSPQQVAAAQRNSRRIGNPQDENLDGVDDDGGNMVQERGRKKRRKD